MAFPKEERDELRRLHAAATAGEWHYDDGVTDGEGTPDAERGKAAWITAKGNVLIAEPSGCDPKEPCVPSLAEMDANGKCIVATHNALIPLLDALDVAEDERGVMRANWARQSAMTDEVRAECDALKAKLAALVKASQPFANDQGCDAVHHGLADRHDQRDTCPVVARLREALAAAKVQP